MTRAIRPRVTSGEYPFEQHVSTAWPLTAEEEGGITIVFNTDPRPDAISDEDGGVTEVVVTETQLEALGYVRA